MVLLSIIITLFGICLGIINKNSKIATIFLVALLFVLLAFERSGESSDYLGYVKMYKEIGSGNGRALTYEKGYILICKLANQIGLTFDGMRGIICILELILLLITIKRYTKNTALVLALFFIFPVMLDAELFRWMLGMCIVIFGLGFLLRERDMWDYVRYGICVSLAGMIHTSCWIFLIFWLLIIKNRKLLYLIVGTCFFAGIALVGSGFFFKLLSLFPIREYVLQKYNISNHANFNGMLYAWLKQMLLLVLAMVSAGKLLIPSCRIVLRKNNYVVGISSNGIIKDKIDCTKTLNDRIVDLNVIGFLLLLVIYYTSTAQRMIHVIVFWNYIALANECDTKKKNSINTLAGIAIAVLFAVLVLFYESTGAVATYTSHFTEGYLINLFETFFTNWIY